MLITFKNVSKRYAGDRLALDSINLTIEQGSMVSVIGPSGAGKTTFIRCINRLIDCTAGTVKIDDEILQKMNSRRLKQVRRKIGMIFQNYNLVERLTVLENTLHGCLGALPLYRSLCGLYTQEERTQALAILEELGLSDYLYQRCADLSGGQKQRTGIARALMQNPQILLCDEPVSSLDPQSAQDILDYIEKIVRTRNLTCIMNLHHVEYAKRYSDRIIGLRNGNVVFDGKPEDLSEKALHTIFSSGSHPEKKDCHEI
ncbi:phosphonate ABC transporter ATP-binding protein [Treponema sp. OMZ 305]|uniref:phosphonate ABC transporter ATP-binding protein n=1 Tax=Treponema sp. OMZ 305 TaxID=1659192 RepID=UPI0020A24290|nr:phosphonate ABC transporter ATP-binding protein [Treponema sp. OMZ 305]